VTASRPKVSVIIPTRDRVAPLRACLTALAQSFPVDAETIVVSDGGTVDLSSVLGEFVDPLRLKLVAVNNGGPAFARNRGLEIAQGAVVIFTDDDCRPRAAWVAAMARAVSGSPPSAAGGVTFNGLPNNAYADAAQVILDLVARHERDSCGEVRFFPANNVAFPRASLMQLGGFDESYRTAEDRELLRRWRAAGYGVRLAIDAIVDHDANSDLVGFIRKFYAYGKGAARFHATSTGTSYGDSVSFHRRIPKLAAPEFRRRGLLGGSSLAALLALWEISNTAGLVAEMTRRAVAVASSNGRRAWNRV
jgi:GT2 family glycosyltransferase